MSSPVAPPVAPPTGSSGYRAVDPEAYIDSRLDEARRHVRAVDLTVAALKLCIGVFAYLMAVAVADHWLVSEGLGRGTRLALWAVLVLVAGWYVVRVLLPLLVHRINPVFAAQTIEQTRPSFKNGLINFLLLRREPEVLQRDEMSKRVYRGLQVRTANELTHVTVGNTVDRLYVIRLGYLLASLVAIACLYFVVSPKNPLTSFGRVILPWARIGAPTRVEISGVEPGDATAYQGDTAMVSAEVRGLRSGEPVTVIYSSVDGESVDQSVPMSVPEGGFRYQGELPPGSQGLQQNLLYRISAGDATSPTFRIDVQIPPAILVDRVEYEYPEYTGLPRRVAIREGDIRGVEGTRVTIYGTANYPIAQAFIELEGDSRHSVRMSANGTAASGRLTLAMSPTDPSQSEYGWYQLRFTDSERRENRRPVRHRIEVIPDRKPDVRFIDPPPEELQLPATSSVDLRVHAEDPDFGLRRVEVRAEREGRGLVIPPLLNKPRPGKPYQGPFEAAYRFHPAKLGLKAGDTVTYWAEAADCKEKEEDKGAAANIAETERRTIHIVAADRRQSPAKQRPEEGASQKRQAGSDQQKSPDRPDNAMQEPSDGDQPQPEKPAGKQQPDQPDKKTPSKSPQPQDKRSPNQQPQDGDEKQPNAGSGDSGTPKEEGGGQKAESGGEKGAGRGEKKDQAEQGEMGDKPSDAAEQGQPDNQGAGQKQPGESAGQKGTSGDKGQEPPKPVDGQTDPAEAIQRILEQRQEEQPKAQPEKQGDAQSKSEPQQGGQNSQDKQASDKQQGGGDQASESQKKGAGKLKPGDTGQPGSKQEASPEQKAGEKSGAAQPKADTQKAANRPEPSTSDKGGQNDQPGAAEQKGADAKGTDSKGADAKGADTKGADAKGDDAKGSDAKSQAGQKGGAGQGKSDQSSGMDEQKGDDGQENGAKSKGAVGKKPSTNEKSSGEPSADQGTDGEKAAAKKEKSDKSSGATRSKASDGSDSAEDAEKGKAGSGLDAETRKKGDAETQKKGDAETRRRGDAEKGKKGEQSTRGDQADAETQKKGDAETRRRGDAEKKGEHGTPGDQQKGAKGTESQPRPESAGAGEPSSEKSSLPTPQEANQPRAKNQGEAGSKKQGGEQDAQSPSISPKTSDSKGGADGDRSGGGKAGGGQKAEQSGSGTPGSKTPSDQGGETSDQQGDGETGTKAGQQAKGDKSTGKSGAKGEAKGSGTGKEPGASDAAKQSQPQGPSQKSTDTAKAGKSGAEQSNGKEPGQKGGSTSGNPTAGGQGGDQPAGDSPSPPPPPAPDDPNLEYAQKQTSLALEYLADQLAKEKPEVLQRLGWDRAYAENFLRQWEQMKKAAGQSGPQGQAAKRELDMALKSLGLRPTKSQVRPGQGPRDKVQQLQGADRIPPPPEWMDQFRAYTEGVGGSKE